MTFSIAQICAEIVRARLASPDRVTRWGNEWAGAGGADDGEPFLSWLTEGGRVTPVQAHLLRQHPEHLVIGGYRVLDRLGKGDLGRVYKALSPAGVVVALKTLPPSRNRDARWVERFVREARIMKRLFHPHLARSLDAGLDKGIYYAVLEYAAGETLDARLSYQARLQQGEACHISYQTLAGLAYLEAHRLAHGNLKPSNLLLAHGGPGDTRPGGLGATVKILDTGLGPAKMQDWSSRADAQINREGFSEPPDCAAYLAPELTRDPWHFDIRSDLFGVGCILYRCLTGSLPFPGDNPTSQMLRRNMGPAQPLQTHGLENCPLLQEFLDHLLAINPAERFPTARAALEAMEGVLLTFAGLQALAAVGEG